MKVMKCTRVRIVNTVYEGKNMFPVHTAVSQWCKFFFIYLCLSTALVCCTQLLLLHSSLVVNGTRWQVGGDGRDYWRT